MMPLPPALAAKLAKRGLLQPDSNLSNKQTTKSTELQNRKSAEGIT